MTILQRLLHSGDGHAARGWRWFGHRDQAVRYTEAWEHETLAEEQARRERGEPEYARICEDVRQAKDEGEGHHHTYTTLAIESNGSPAPGIMPEPVRVHDEPVARTAARGERPTARLCVRGPATRSPVRDEPTKLGVV